MCTLSRFGFEGPGLKQVSALFVDGLFFKCRCSELVTIQRYLTSAPLSLEVERMSNWFVEVAFSTVSKFLCQIINILYLVGQEARKEAIR